MSPGAGGVGASAGTGGASGTGCVLGAAIYTVAYSCGSNQFQATWAVSKDLPCPSTTTGIPLPSGNLGAIIPGATFCSAIMSSGLTATWTPEGGVGSVSLEFNCSTSRGTQIEIDLCGITVTH